MNHLFSKSAVQSTTKERSTTRFSMISSGHLSELWKLARSQFDDLSWFSVFNKGDFPVRYGFFSESIIIFPHDIPVIFHDFPFLSPWYSHDISFLSPWYSPDIPINYTIINSQFYPSTPRGCKRRSEKGSPGRSFDAGRSTSLGRWVSNVAVVNLPSGYVKIAIENGPCIVDLPIKDGVKSSVNGGLPSGYVNT